MTTHVGKGEAGGLKSTGLESHEKVVLSPGRQQCKLQVVVLWVTLQSTAVPLHSPSAPRGQSAALWSANITLHSAVP